MNRTAMLSNSLMLVLLLGASGSLAGALSILSTFAVVVGLYGLSMKPLRVRLGGEHSLLASLLLAATLASCADILLQRWSLQLHTLTGVYTGLIGLQCVVLEHNGFFRQTASERLKLCGQFVGLMIAMAASRELIGHGRIDFHLAEHWKGVVVSGEGLHLLTLAPGAFILLGLLVAAHRAWTRPAALSEETQRP